MEIRVTVFVCLLTSLAGCAPPAEVKHWSEEVDLGDGRVQLIHRTEKYTTSNSWSGDAFNAEDLESVISFESWSPTVLPWNTELVPVLLYQDPANQQWVVVASSFSCETWIKHKQPKPPYWEYRLLNGSWIQVPLSQASYFRRANLFFMYHSTLPAVPILRAEKDRIRDKARVLDFLKTVDPNANANCT